MAEQNIPPENQEQEPGPEDQVKEFDSEEQPEPGHNSVLFTIGREVFAIPLEDIDEIYKFEDITHLPTAPDFLVGVINVHGNLASVINLAAVMGIEDSVESDLTIILIPEMGGIAIQVDSTSGFARYSVLEEVASGFDSSFDTSGEITFVEGVFKTDKGLVSLINPRKLQIWIDGAFSKGDD